MPFLWQTAIVLSGMAGRVNPDRRDSEAVCKNFLKIASALNDNVVVAGTRVEPERNLADPQKGR